MENHQNNPLHSEQNVFVLTFLHLIFKYSENLAGLKKVKTLKFLKIFAVWATLFTSALKRSSTRPKNFYGEKEISEKTFEFKLSVSIWKITHQLFISKLIAACPELKDVSLGKIIYFYSVCRVGVKIFWICFLTVFSKFTYTREHFWRKKTWWNFLMRKTLWCLSGIFFHSHSQVWVLIADRTLLPGRIFFVIIRLFENVSEVLLPQFIFTCPRQKFDSGETLRKNVCLHVFSRPARGNILVACFKTDFEICLADVFADNVSEKTLRFFPSSSRKSIDVANKIEWSRQKTLWTKSFLKHLQAFVWLFDLWAETSELFPWKNFSACPEEQFWRNFPRILQIYGCSDWGTFPLNCQNWNLRFLRNIGDHIVLLKFIVHFSSLNQCFSTTVLKRGFKLIRKIYSSEIFQKQIMF